MGRRAGPNFCRTLASILLMLAVTSAVADAGGPATARELTRDILAARARVRVLTLQYRLTSSAMTARPPGQYVQRTMAADRQGRFFLDNGHGHDSMSPEEDPYRKLSFVGATGTDIVLPLDRVVERYPPPVPASYVAALPGELIFLLGWWPFPDAPEPQILGRSCSFGSWAGDEFVLRPERVLVDDAECHVLQVPGIETIWVDASDGCTIRRRELRDPVTGALAFRVDFHDVRDVGHGVRYPFAVRLADFDHAAPSPRDRLRCLNTITVTVLDVRLNEEARIPELKDRLPPGAITRTSGPDYDLIAAGEAEHLQSMVTWGRKQLASRPERPKTPAVFAVLTALGYLATGILAGSLLLWQRA